MISKLTVTKKTRIEKKTGKKDAKNKTKRRDELLFIKVDKMDEGRIMRPPYIMAV